MDAICHFCCFKKYIPAVFIIVLSTLSACDFQSASSERQLYQAIDSFTVTYYNWQFHKTVSFTTPESIPWLQYAASQVQQEDIDQLHKQAGNFNYQIDDVIFDNDSLATVHITVENFLAMDSIGSRQCRLMEKAHYTLKLEYNAKRQKWLVHLNGLPREQKKPSTN